jgi:hypothetical protein
LIIDFIVQNDRVIIISEEIGSLRMIP